MFRSHSNENLQTTSNLRRRDYINVHDCEKTYVISFLNKAIKKQLILKIEKDESVDL